LFRRLALQGKYQSFQRQLNIYGFKRLTTGRDKGSYYHDCFLRGKRFLCQRIERTKVKGTKTRHASSPESEPNFYLAPYLPAEGFANVAKQIGRENGLSSVSNSPDLRAAARRNGSLAFGLPVRPGLVVPSIALIGGVPSVAPSPPAWYFAPSPLLDPVSAALLLENQRAQQQAALADRLRQDRVRELLLSSTGVGAPPATSTANASNRALLPPAAFALDEATLRRAVAASAARGLGGNPSYLNFGGI